MRVLQEPHASVVAELFEQGELSCIGCLYSAAAEQLSKAER